MGKLSAASPVAVGRGRDGSGVVRVAVAGLPGGLMDGASLVAVRRCRAALSAAAAWAACCWDSRSSARASASAARRTISTIGVRVRSSVR